VPNWYGPVLPRVLGRGAPLNLVSPFATSDPQQRGPIFPASSSYNDSIVSALNMLFGTRPGERIYLPDYGLNMEAFVYEPLDEQMTADAQAGIKAAVERYIPQVQVVQVTLSKNADANAVAFILTMQVRGSTPNDLLTYSTPSTPAA
jgi:phage baseplate assembly protein W